MSGNKAVTRAKVWRNLLLAILCLFLAFLFSPGGTRELLRVIPSGVQDNAGWTAGSTGTPSDVSIDGRSVRFNDFTFQFNGEKYFIPLSRVARIPPIYSVSFWVRITGDGGGTPLLAIEAEKGNSLFFLFAQSNLWHTKFGCVMADHFGKQIGLASEPDQVFDTNEWIHVAYVVNYEAGVQTMYINGWKQNARNMSAGSVPPLVPCRLWIGSTLDNGLTLPCQIQDVRVIEGALGWWQIQTYMLFNRYSLSFFGIPLSVVFLLCSAGSVVFFGMASYAAARRNTPVSGPPAALPVPGLDSPGVRSIHNVVLLLIAVAGFLFIAAAFYPGAMSVDTVEQYRQGRVWEFGDWHAPFMAAVFGIFDRVFHSPAPFMFIQVFLYWLAFYLFARSFLRVSVPVAYVFGVLGFWPAFITWTGVLWKDTGTAVGFLLASAVLVHYSVQGRRPPWAMAAAVVLSLLYGTLVRPYSFLGYIPLILWLAFLLRNTPSPKHRRLRLVSLSLAGVLLFPAANAVVNLILRPAPQCPIQSVLFHDLVGISVLSGEKCLVHPYHRPQFDCSMIKGFYTPVCHDTITLNTRGLMNKVTNIAPLCHDWLKAVLAHPRAYLEHRWSVFTILLGFGDRPSWHYIREIEKNPFGFKLESGEMGKWFDSYIEHSPDWIFFGYVYLVPALFEAIYLIVLLFVRRSLSNLASSEVPIFFLALSSLCFLLPYFFLVPSRDYRYLYWGTIASTLALILMLYNLVGNPNVTTSRTTPCSGTVPRSRG